ncbi:hypothetical protein NPIL_121061, partial [Nephila pilipes]
ASLPMVTIEEDNEPQPGKVCGRGVAYDVDDALDVYSAENVLEVESFGYIWVVVRDSGS